MSERTLTDIVREAKAASAALHQASQDLERVIGDVEAAIASLGLRDPARVYLPHGALVFRPFGEGSGFRLVVESTRSFHRMRPLAAVRDGLLEEGIAAIPSSSRSSRGLLGSGPRRWRPGPQRREWFETVC